MKLLNFLLSILPLVYSFLARTFSFKPSLWRARIDAINRTTILSNPMSSPDDRRLLRHIQFSPCIKRGLQVCLLSSKLRYYPSHPLAMLRLILLQLPVIPIRLALAAADFVKLDIVDRYR